MTDNEGADSASIKFPIRLDPRDWNALHTIARKQRMEGDKAASAQTVAIRALSDYFVKHGLEPAVTPIRARGGKRTKGAKDTGAGD